MRTGSGSGGLPDGAPLGTLSHPVRVTALTISDDGSRLISNDDHGVVRVWSLPEGRLLVTLDNLTLRRGGRLAVSPDGRVVAHGGHCLRRLPDGGVLLLESGNAFAPAFSPESGLLATAEGELIRLRSLHDLNRMSEARGHQKEVTCLAMSPDGRFLASGGEGRDVYLWNLPDGTLFSELKGHRGAITCLAISPDGRTVVVGCKKGSVTFWEVTATDA